MEKYQEALAELLELTDRSQRWLSKQVNVTQAAVNYVANGKRGLTVDKFAAWCKALGATVTAEWKNPGDERERKKWVL